MSEYHIPVLLHESVDALVTDPAGLYADATFGGGSHSREILSRLGPEGRLFAFDRDADALANAPEDTRLTLIHNNFRFIHNYMLLECRSTGSTLHHSTGSALHHSTGNALHHSTGSAAPDMRMNAQDGKTGAAATAAGCSRRSSAARCRASGRAHRAGSGCAARGCAVGRRRRFAAGRVKRRSERCAPAEVRKFCP